MQKILCILYASSTLLLSACASGVSSYADAPIGGGSVASPIATIAPAAPAKALSGKNDYLCGDQSVTFTAHDSTGDLQIANTSYAMQQVVAASGAKYENLGDNSTIFWSKGTEAMLTVKGQDYPPCKQIPQPQKERPVSPDGVRNISWLLEDINNTGVIDNSHVTLTFGMDGRIHGNAGCNAYGGQYELNGQALTISPNLISTMMACAAPAMMQQENRFTALLPQMKKVQLLKTGALVLMANDGRLMHFMPED